jgi:hypothetical protein
MLFLTDDQQQRVNICEDLCQIASNNATILTMEKSQTKNSETGDEQRQEHAHHFVSHQGNCS